MLSDAWFYDYQVLRYLLSSCHWCIYMLMCITVNTIYIYTVGHNKRATLFLITTPAPLGRFLCFLYQWKQEGILYGGLTKFTSYSVSPYYLVKLKTSYKQHILNQSSQCIWSEWLFATLAESLQVFVFSCSWYGILLSVFCQNLWHIATGFW